jgi:hypothetical protein
MPQVVAITNAAGTPLPVASPRDYSQAALRKEVEVVEVTSDLSSGLIVGRDLPTL